MSYRLVSVEVAGFRGFNKPQYISLNNDLVVIYAPNGHGKSSFCEAVEWGLYGATSRKTQGEKLIHKREFDGCLRNRHYPKNKEPYVILILEDASKRIEIKRVVSTNEDAGVLFVNGARTSSISTIGMPETIHFPLILQHSLRDFILAKPADRFTQVSSQLGLGPFTNFQEALQNSSRSFKTKPTDVEHAKRTRTDFLDKAFSLYDLTPVVKTLSQDNATAEELWAAVSQVLEQVYDMQPLTREDALTRIQVEVQKTIARAFDAAKLNIDQDIEPVFLALCSELEVLAGEMSDRRDEFSSAKPQEIRQREVKLAELARLSLPLIDFASPTCPVCGQPLAPPQMDLINERSKMETTTLDPCNLLDAWLVKLNSVERTSRLLPAVLLGQDDLDRLRSLLGSSNEVLSSYAESQSVSTSDLSIFSAAVGTARESVERIRKDLGLSEDARDEIDLLVQETKDLREQLRRIRAARQDLVDVYRMISVLVKGKVASSDEVTQLQLLDVCISKSDELLLACRDSWVESQAEKAVKLVQDFGLNKRKETLALKSAEMAQWFSILHPDPEVRFTKFSPTASQISLLGEVFGEEVNVSSVFSEAQLNCLGLSFYAVRAQASDNPFAFVLIDDPVQSMDQQHIEHFKDNYLRTLLASSKQIILLTHMQSLSNSIATLYRHIAPSVLEIETYRQDGPSIKERDEPLGRKIRDIEFYMGGDAVRRRRSGAVLRELLERLVKEFYRKKHGDLPAKYEGAMWVNLKPLIHDSGLTLADEGKLFAAYNFCVSFPHDDPTHEPPTGDEIKAKLRSLQKMMGDYLVVPQKSGVHGQLPRSANVRPETTGA